MELIFLLIFIAFIFLNVVLGLISSRAKKRKQMEAAEKFSEKKPSLEPTHTGKPSVGYDSFLGVQTAEGIVKPLYQEPEKAQRMQPQTDYEGPTAIAEEIAPTIDETAPFPGGEVPVVQTEKEKLKDQKQPFYPERVVELVEVARQRADSRRPMADLTESTKRVSSNLWMLVQSLPSLQRAVVLSEILGQPKGMTPHNDQR